MESPNQFLLWHLFNSIRKLRSSEDINAACFWASSEWRSGSTLPLSGWPDQTDRHDWSESDCTPDRTGKERPDQEVFTVRRKKRWSQWSGRKGRGTEEEKEMRQKHWRRRWRTKRNLEMRWKKEARKGKESRGVDEENWRWEQVKKKRRQREERIKSNSRWRGEEWRSKQLHVLHYNSCRFHGSADAF